MRESFPSLDPGVRIVLTRLSLVCGNPRVLDFEGGVAPLEIGRTRAGSRVTETLQDVTPRIACGTRWPKWLPSPESFAFPLFVSFPEKDSFGLGSLLKLRRERENHN